MGKTKYFTVSRKRWGAGQKLAVKVFQDENKGKNWDPPRDFMKNINLIYGLERSSQGPQGQDLKQGDMS